MIKFIHFSLILFFIITIKIVQSESSSYTGKCGKGIGSCRKDECCSKYGWCGKTDDYCGKGCQSEFGKCNSKTNDNKISKDGRCGKGVGICKKDECCSKYGWCGKTDKHCKVEEGCQSEFGKCKSSSTTITTTSTKPNASSQTPYNGKCGKEYGSCRKGECCSKYGWCGKTNDYCGKGCQSEFGECKSTSTTVSTTSTKPNTSSQTPYSGKCGKEYGSCRKGECCSKYGWCGKTNDYCGEGCKSEFGVCNNNNNNNNNNENNGNNNNENNNNGNNNNENPVNNSTDVSNSNLDFDFSFLKLENNKKNMLYSPLSIKYALKMLEEGANGNTYDEINKVVGNEELSKYTSIDKTLSLANGLFIRDTYYERIKKSYINILKEKYDAEIVQDEFKDAQNANQWIEDKTLGIIKDMLQDDVVQNPDTMMLLINALAIDMDWVLNFECIDTSGKTFYMDDGKEMKATMMSKEEVSSKAVAYYIDNDITVLTMDLENYNGTQFEFMAIMPNENLSSYIENVSKEQINEIDKKLILSSDEQGGVNVMIPKFKFSYDLKLKNDLIELGIKDAFDAKSADLSKMEDTKELYVSNALHKADIEFTEEGVKAAAVTVFIIESMSLPPEKEPVDVIINKPFMFIIRDKNTKAIWFTGTVYEPNSWENDEETYKSSYDQYEGYEY